MPEHAIFDGLNPEQRRAVEAVRGPVCILAGAGSGKTTTITHRVANQVATGAFRSDEILAVTFTDKAAGEMRARLERLDVTGVRASTFHSAALGQLRFFAPEPPGKIMASKALPLRYIGNSLPRPYRFRPAADLATEVEWAKNRRIPPGDYLHSLGEHEPPIPKDLMVKVYRDYERRKADQGYVDFEDLIEMAIRLFDADGGALDQVRERYRAFTVDEYQDVNLLQQTLLDRTSRSMPSRARAPNTCSQCRSGSRPRPSSGWRRTTARPWRCSRSRTGWYRGSAGRRRCSAPPAPREPSR